MNLDSLRRKRTKRKGLKSGGHAGQRRIFFVLDRATKRFSGDIGLWMQYIDFARKQKANKKMSQILTTVLRLHPTNPELWIYAANYALDEKSDMTEARSCMQRGLRFCKQSKHLWTEYTKLEMMYISRIHARGHILGFQRPAERIADLGNGTVALPRIEANETDSEEFEYIDKEILEKLQETPALSGAIPIAIFDAAMKQFPSDSDLGKHLFETVALFQGIPCVARILRHIVQKLQDTNSSSPATMSCLFREPTSCVEISSGDFPAAVRGSLDRLKACLAALSKSSNPQILARSRSILARETIHWALGLLVHEDLDQDITKVLLALVKKTWNQLLVDLEVSPGIDGKEFFKVLEALQSQGFKTITEVGVTVGSRLWPTKIEWSAIHQGAPNKDV